MAATAAAPTQDGGPVNEIADWAAEKGVSRDASPFVTPYRLGLLCAIRILARTELPPEAMQAVLLVMFKDTKADIGMSQASYGELLGKLQRAGTPAFAEAVQRSVAGIENVQSLYELVEELRELVALEDDASVAHILYPNSTFGIFVRRSTLDLQQRSFEDLCGLFLQFDAFRRGSSSVLQPDDASMTVMDQFVRAQLDGLITRQVPESVVATMRRLAQEHPSMSRVQLAQYFVGIQRSDFTMAVEALHRFFDYATAHDGRATHFEEPEAMMADLLAQFGLHAEAEIHIDEAVRHARTLRDRDALEQLHVWREHILGGGQLSGDAAERSAPLALSVASGAQPPLDATRSDFRSLLDAEQLLNSGGAPHAVLAAIEASRSGAMDASTGGAAPAVHQAARRAAASAWELYGFHSLSELYTQLGSARARAPVAGDDASGALSAAALAAWCSLAERAAEQGDRATVDRVLLDLEQAVPRTLRTAEAWMRTRARIDLTDALHREDLVAVEQLLASAAVTLDDIEQRYYHALYLARTGAVRQAVTALVALAESLLNGDGPPQMARASPVLLAAATALVDAGAFDPALPLVLRTLVLSAAAFHTKCHRLAQLLLVRCFTQMERAQDGMRILAQVYPEILADGSLSLAANAALVYAECALAARGGSGGLGASQLADIAGYLQLAGHAYERLRSRAGLLRVAFVRVALAVTADDKDAAVREARAFLERMQAPVASTV